LPQRPQFLSFSEACAIAFLPTVMFIDVSFAPRCPVRGRDIGAGDRKGLPALGRLAGRADHSALAFRLATCSHLEVGIPR
jgi:hypothetical protein